MVNIGRKIKAARRKKGMSQEELAQAIGSTKSAISRYEAGKRQPRYDQLQRIAEALGVSVHTLVDWGSVGEKEFIDLFILGEGPDGDSSEAHASTQPNVVVHGEPIQAPEVIVYEGTPPAEMEAQGVRGDRHRTYVVPHISCKLDSGISKQINKNLQHRIAAALDKLNEKGQEKAAERVEELTEIPRYRAETAPESTPAPPEKDTTPPPDAPETASEGE